RREITNHGTWISAGPANVPCVHNIAVFVLCRADVTYDYVITSVTVKTVIALGVHSKLYHFLL
ncbi:hypothetical protein B296_00024660, partial [Ensete ventricosum]